MKIRFRALSVLAISIACAPMAFAGSADFEKWLRDETALSWMQLEANVSPPGALPGVVIASPTRDEPDYYKHWVRDSALVMDVWVTRFENEKSPAGRDFVKRRLLEFVELSRRLQKTPNPSGDLTTGGLGEPLFEVNGSPMWSSWGRPQTDGPALRAITLVHWAEVLLARGETDFVRRELYDPAVMMDSVLKTDLDYVEAHGEDPAFDIWEETHGHHFYNRMVQRKALKMGGRLARRLGDARAAERYREKATRLATELAAHWDPIRGYLVETLDWDGGNAAKKTNLDTAILLGVLHGGTGDQLMSTTDDRVLATAARLWRTFNELYPCNETRKDGAGQELAPAIGRYPEDVYEGNQRNAEGSPWALLTFAFAEYNDRVAAEYLRHGEIAVSGLSHSFLEIASPGTKFRVGERVTSRDPRFQAIIQSLRAHADGFLDRVRVVATDGHLSEQMNRRSGKMQSAADLSWSYSAFLTAVGERQRARATH